LTATYRNSSISFSYPENWQLSESDSESDASASQISLETPAGGLWLLYHSPASTDSEKAVREVMQAINEQFSDVEWSESNEPFYGFQSSGFDGFFYSLDLLIQSRVRVFKTLDRTFLVLVQSESREFDQMEPVFNAITLSLLRSNSALRSEAEETA
jgi:hypothetical protein